MLWKIRNYNQGVGGRKLELNIYGNMKNTVMLECTKLLTHLQMHCIQMLKAQLITTPILMEQSPQLFE